MASYINTAYLQGKLGTDFYTANVAVTGIDVTQMIVEMTDVIRAALKGAGYEDIDVSDGGVTLPNQLPRLAVYALVHEALSDIPDVCCPLPDGWADKPARQALDDIRSGEADLTGWPRDTASAVGGVLFTSDDASLDAATPQYTSRDNMRGF